MGRSSDTGAGPASPPVAVIVLTWNGLSYNRVCLESIMGSTTDSDFELIVVDNGSTDGTREYLEGLEGIRLIANEENLGFVRGNNMGIEATDRDVILLNNDTEIIDPGWISALQDTAYSADDIGVVGCRLVDGENRLVHAGTYMPLPSLWGQEYPGGQKDIGQYVRDREVEGVIFACAYIKRELIDEVGVLDEDFISYYEDTDYCLKAVRAGYRVFCCGSTTVRHLENVSTDLNRMDFSGTFRRSREVFKSKWEDFLRGRYSRRMTWRSRISGDDMYGRVSAKLLWALERAGVDLNLGFLEGADRAELNDFRINDMKNRGGDRDRPQVVFGSPEALDQADGSYNIGYVFTPYDRFPGKWVRSMNRMDEIWVTSEFQRGAAVASGVKNEILVMPLGVDPDYFHPGIASYPLTERFTFLASVDWGGRFACETLLRAFTDEFDPGEGVALIMQVSAPGTGVDVEEEVEGMNLGLNRAPVVLLINRDIPPYQAGSLLRSADCLVSVDQSAETGTRLVEALSCGKPVLTVGWGSAEGLAGSAAVRGIDCELVPAPVEGMRWAQPDYGHLRRSLRSALRDEGGMRRAAELESGRISSELDWDKIARRIVKRLDEIT